MTQIELNYNNLNWNKLDGLIPAIIQNARTGTVLMLGFMNKEALQATLNTRKVTFFSRTKQKLWVKGELSGNYLTVMNIIPDCDNDTLLIMANPEGPTCHKGEQSCFKTHVICNWNILQNLESIILSRASEKSPDSYTVSLFDGGINKITQKIGEEAIETVIAGLKESDDKLCNEIADLIYHILVLLNFRKLNLNKVLDILVVRSKGAKD